MKNGDFIILRDRSEGVFVNEGFVFRDGDLMRLSITDENFSSKVNTNLDIMKVYRPDASNACFKSFKNGRLMYDKNEAKEMTLSQVSKELGVMVKIIPE